MDMRVESEAAIVVYVANLTADLIKLVREVGVKTFDIGENRFQVEYIEKGTFLASASVNGAALDTFDYVDRVFESVRHHMACASALKDSLVEQILNREMKAETKCAPDLKVNLVAPNSTGSAQDRRIEKNRKALEEARDALRQGSEAIERLDVSV